MGIYIIHGIKIICLYIDSFLVLTRVYKKPLSNDKGLHIYIYELTFSSCGFFINPILWTPAKIPSNTMAITK